MDKEKGWRFMPYTKNTCCPKCGKELKLDESGRIGWCSVHHSWFAVVPGAENEALAKTSEYQKQKEQERLKQIKERELMQEEKIEKKNSQKRQKTLALIVVFLIAIALIGVLIIKPALLYKNATNLLLNEDYKEANKIFTKLGKYKDSERQSNLTSILSSGNIISHMFDDVDGDEKEDLIVLFEDYKIKVYSEENQNNAILLDNKALAGYLTLFGNDLQDSKSNDSAECFKEAYKLNPTEETRKRLAECYRNIAYSKEANEEYQEAVLNRNLAVETSGDEVDFDEYYNAELRYVKRNTAQEAVKEWDSFVVSESFIIEKFNAQAKAFEEAGKLRIAYAIELAKEKNPAAVEVLKNTRNYPVDISQSILQCIENFTLGKERIQLRLMLIEAMEEQHTIDEQRTLIKQETASILESWKSLGLSGHDVLQIIRLCKENEIKITDSTNTYREAALSTCNQHFKLHSFIDLDGDGFEELIAMTNAGTLSYWKMENDWNCKTSFETTFAKPSFILIKSDIQLILVESENDVAFAVYGFKEGNLTKLLEETSIVDFQRDKFKITYARVLDGSITRKEAFAYTLFPSNLKPVRTGIDWNKTNYNYPTSSFDTVIRWIETVFYDIPQERNLLLGSKSYTELGFSLALTEKQEKPKNLENVVATCYWKDENVELYILDYKDVEDKSKTVFIATTKDENGHWKVSGTSNNYSSKTKQLEKELSNTILALNSKITGKDKVGTKTTYQLLVPTNSKIILNWQSGTNRNSKTAYILKLYSKEAPQKAIFDYELSTMPEIQISTPVFITAGVYFLEVETKTNDSPTYNVKIEAIPTEFMEIEENGSFTSATQVKLNTIYSASLINKKDEDCFAFNIPSSGKVSVNISAESIDNGKTRYIVEIYDKETRQMLTATEMAGNDSSIQTTNLYLGKGSYIAKVSSGNYYSGDEYKLLVNYSKTDNIEQESNDSQKTATPISTNREIKGSFGTSGDIDCYKFTLYKDSIVKPQFTFIPIDSNSKTFIISIHDENQKLYSASIGGKENQKDLSPIVLPKGTYIVKLENPRFNGNEYKLNITTTAVAKAETEPNDSLSQATELKINAEVSGVLSTETDIDYFRLVVDKTSYAKLTLTFSKQENRSSAFLVSIEQNGKTAWKADAKWYEGLLEQEFQFEPGEYYIKVAPSTWDDEIYKLSVVMTNEH